MEPQFPVIRHLCLLLVGASHRGRHMIHDDIQVRTTEDGIADEIFFENFGEGTSTAVPSALTRWAEEGQILDAQGIHYCVAAVKPEIIPVLLKHQAEEIAKGREEEQKKKAEAEAKSAAAKKEEEEKKKQKSSKGGGETSAAVEGQSTSTEAAASLEAQSEGMQVEQQPVASESEPASSEEGAAVETCVLITMDEPALDTSTTSADQAAVRTSTPANEGEDHTAVLSTLTPPTAARSVVQDILSAATVEAASLSAGDEVPPPPPATDTAQGATSDAEGTEQEVRQQEGDGSPMAIGEEGTAASTGAEIADDAVAGGCLFYFKNPLFLQKCIYVPSLP